MHIIRGRVLSVGLVLLALVAGGADVQAMQIIAGGAACVPFGTTGFGDLDIDNTGAMGVKASAINSVVCSIPREGGLGVDQPVLMFGTKSSPFQFFVFVTATDFTGAPLGVFSVPIPATIGPYSTSVMLPASALPTFGYLSIFAELPGSHTGKILSYVGNN